jgi:ribonuclease HI
VEIGKMVEKVSMYIDGCSKGNPGCAGAGVCIIDPKGNIMKEACFYLGDKLTNNQAEYYALLHGLNECKGICQGEVMVYSDSQLLVNQLNREYLIRNAKLRELVEQVKNKERLFEKITYTHIERSKNHRADWLANKAIRDHSTRQGFNLNKN